MVRPPPPSKIGASLSGPKMTTKDGRFDVWLGRCYIEGDSILVTQSRTSAVS